MIELRSDTKTMPSPGMREAMAHAKVGDEQAREDPTVIALEAAAAAFVGQEEAVYLPTASMANAIALVLLGERGSVLLAEESAHVLAFELAGAAVYAGLLSRPLPGNAGLLTPEQIRAAAFPGSAMHTPQPSVLAIENSHNSAGGTAWPYEDLENVVAAARELDIRVHLDGARLPNGALAIGRSAAEVGALFDTVTLCLSKGLGCPLGAVLAGSRSLMARARLEKHRFGGAMRQAGIVAAAGLYALEHNVERLAEDHARARRLAEGWKAAGLAVDLARVQTNFVQIDVGALGFTTPQALGLLADAGVLLSATIRPGVIRALTHLDVDDADIEQAVELAPPALGA
ncbi:MAG TPA: GntG family PLP-dependent aldolase [Solirubrobacteraceae bacterium]|jgi:threonine aldolase